jgi:hypothetical protein
MTIAVTDCHNMAERYAVNEDRAKFCAEAIACVHQGLVDRFNNRGWRKTKY